MNKSLLILVLTVLHSAAFASWNSDSAAKAMATATNAARSLAQISLQSREPAPVKAESYSPGAQAISHHASSMTIRVPIVTSIQGGEQFSEIYRVKIEPNGTVTSIELTEEVDP